MSRLKITLRVDFDAVHSIGPGKVALLEKMRDSGSLSQAAREVLERQLESTRLAATLRRLSASAVVVRQPRRVTPLAFPLLVDRARERVSSESLADRIRRMQLALERAAG